jgi:hypothetical protein
MGQMTFNRAGALRDLAENLDDAIGDIAHQIARLAKSLAPVRKTRPYQRKRNLRRPLALAYFKEGTNERVSQQEIASLLGGVAEHRERAAKSPSMKMGGMNVNAPRPVVENRPLGSIMVGGRLQPRRPMVGRPISYRAAPRRSGSYYEILRSQGVEIRPVGERISSRVHAEVRRGVGLHFETEDVSNERGNLKTVPTGRVTYGGQLRRSISVVKHNYERSLKVGRTVQATAPYAYYVEFGMAPHRARAKRPFMLPAFAAYATAENVAAKMKQR